MGIVHAGIPQRLALWLRDQAATPDFIETGTYLADTALWAVQHFERVISIEADRELCDAARKRLASYANVNVLLGRSQDVLAALVPKLSRPALIWLDAHWCGGDVAVAGEHQECPLLEEITHWPSAGAVIEQLRAKYDGYICVADDVIIRLPLALRDSFEAFISHRPRTTLRAVIKQVFAPVGKVTA